MAQQLLTGGDGTTGQTGLESRVIIDANFTELYAASNTIHDRGNWNTLDELPNGTGSGTAGANVKYDFWFVPTLAGWNYNGQFFAQWTKIEAMTNGANAIENFKIYPS